MGALHEGHLELIHFPPSSKVSTVIEVLLNEFDNLTDVQLYNMRLKRDLTYCMLHD